MIDTIMGIRDPMKRKLMFILMGIVATCEVRSVEPITMLGASAFAVGAVWRTAIGKIALGAFLAKATQTEIGKKLVDNMKINTWQKFKKEMPLFVSQHIPEAINSAKVQVNNSLLVKRFQDFIEKQRSDLSATRVRMEENSSVMQGEVWSKNIAAQVRDKVSGEYNQALGKVNLTQYNTQNNAHVENNGFFSRTYINDPIKTKEFADAKVAAAAGRYHAESSYWKGKYKGLRNGVAGVFGLGGATYWVFGKKKNEPIIVVVDRDQYYPRGSAVRFRQ